MTVLEILIKYQQGFLSGLKVTLQLCLIIWSSGLFFGTILGGLSARITWLSIIARLGSFTLSGIPILVFLFWLHFPAQAVFNVVVDPFFTAAFVLSIVNLFAVADIVRAALQEFPEQYNTAAKVCGISGLDTLLFIQVPIIFRQTLPTLIITQVSMLQATLFASLISVEEIFRVAQRINASIYKPVEIYTALGIFFLAVCLPLNGFAYWFRNTFTRNLSES
jgi:ABC-type amino acid transport system permease subunit